MTDSKSEDRGAQSPATRRLALPSKTAAIARRLADDNSLLTRMISRSARWPDAACRKEGFLRLLWRAAHSPEFLTSVQSCRDSIVRSAIKQQDRTEGLVIGLTGADGREGSSFLSLLLTLALGGSPRCRVAYLDCSFGLKRFRDLTKLFSLQQNCAAVNKGETQLLGYYNETYPNVYFLKQSEAENKLSFFSDTELESCMSRLRASFDFTIVDMPPLLTDSSSHFVAPTVDRLYLAVSAGETRLAQIDRCMTVAQETGTEISGVIVNRQKAPLWTRAFWREYFF